MAKPVPTDGHLRFRAFHQARGDALQELSGRLAGEDITAGPDEPAYEVARRRREVILAWGNQPGRTEDDAVEALRAAALAVADEGDEAEEEQ
ncbi:DUF6197 family protein [Streptomyces noursei]|uniref:DUF6197 family protein n=1 Tax=Streptomyces noursei TaxID=1971 RepID=UPI00382321E1